MNIDVTIERIDNGYIVINNDSSKNKYYFSSLEKFAESRLIEDLREIDQSICEQGKPDKPFHFKLVSDL